jgi:multicomponent Na+:H+ antiporter subunit E
MRMLGWNLGLALMWCALAGRLEISHLLVGFAVGYVLIGWLIPSDDARAYLRRLPLLIAFFGYYALDVLVSSVRLAREVLTPFPRRRPGMVAVPLDVTSDAQIAMLANVITFTPGTIAIDLSEDRRTMFIHDMFLQDPDASRDHIKRRYERWTLRILG